MRAANKRADSAFAGVAGAVRGVVRVGLLATGALLLSAVVTSAGCVDLKGKNDCFTSIQEAVDAAQPGEVISIGPGNYLENVMVDVSKSGLRLEGASETRTVIDADQPNTGVGLTIKAPLVSVTNLTVRNGVSIGIAVAASADAVSISKVRVLGPRGDCVQGLADKLFLEGVTLVGCGDQAVDVTGSSLHLSKSRIASAGNGSGCVAVTGSDAELELNQISGCDATCVNITGDSARVERNQFSNCEDDGISITGGSASVFSNRIENLDGDGINVRGENPQILRNKVKATFSGVAAINVECDPCTNGQVSGNRVEAIADKDMGIRVLAAGPGEMLVEANSVKRSGDTAIRVEGTSVTLRRNKVQSAGMEPTAAGFEVLGTGHTLISNKVRKVAGDGFHVEGTGHVLVGNQAIDCIEDGFDLEAFDGGVAPSGITLEDNKAKRNTGVGIEISSGSQGVTVRGNLSIRNRTDFCDEGDATVLGENRFDSVGDCAVDFNGFRSRDEPDDDDGL